MITLVMLMTTVVVPAGPPPKILMPDSEVFRPYVACLSKQATALELSNASVNDIFDASVTACDQQWVKTFEALKDQFVEGSRQNAIEGVHDRAQKTMRMFVPTWKSNLGLAILRQRAARNAR